MNGTGGVGRRVEEEAWGKRGGGGGGRGGVKVREFAMPGREGKEKVPL